jgi:hypothetical protein
MDYRSNYGGVLRDLRDPQAVGEALLRDAKAVREHYEIPNEPLTKVWDIHTGNYKHPEVSKDESLGKECVRAYREELESRAAEGDRYAKSALDSINAGKGVQGYDDAGS